VARGTFSHPNEKSEASMTPIQSIKAGDRRVANIFEASFTSFVYPDGRSHGDAILQLDSELPLGIGFHVYRMPAGLSTRPHAHNGNEQFLILEGELIDNDGTHYRKGDLVWLRSGTEHSSYTPNGCLLAVHIAGAETILE
jgi:hypothetical protein